MAQHGRAQRGKAHWGRGEGTTPPDRVSGRRRAAALLGIATFLLIWQADPAATRAESSRRTSATTEETPQAPPQGVNPQAWDVAQSVKNAQEVWLNILYTAPVRPVWTLDRQTPNDPQLKLTTTTRPTRDVLPIGRDQMNVLIEDLARDGFLDHVRADAVFPGLRGPTYHIAILSQGSPGRRTGRTETPRRTFQENLGYNKKTHARLLRFRKHLTGDPAAQMDLILERLKTADGADLDDARAADREAALSEAQRRLSDAVKGLVWEKKTEWECSNNVPALVAAKGTFGPSIFVYPFPPEGPNWRFMHPTAFNLTAVVVGRNDRWTVVAAREQDEQAKQVAAALRLDPVQCPLWHFHAVESTRADFAYLLEHSDQLEIRLEYNGRLEKELVSLAFTCAEAPPDRLRPNTLHVVIDVNQAKAILAHCLRLAEVMPSPEADPFSRHEQGYRISVGRFPKDSDNFRRDLGWSFSMVLRLQEFAKTLKGDAAQAMDKLMAALDEK